MAEQEFRTVAQRARREILSRLADRGRRGRAVGFAILLRVFVKEKRDRGEEKRKAITQRCEERTRFTEPCDIMAVQMT